MTSLPQADFCRPRTLLAVTQRSGQDAEEFDYAICEFLDEYYADRNRDRRSAMLAPAPLPLTPYLDAFLGGLAEHLAASYGLAPPGWCSGYGYALRRPVFTGNTEYGKAYLLVHGLPTFRERMIFILAQDLHRV